MALLTDESLEFAKEHISKFYDSDFFPKPFEYEALWHHWPEVKKELAGKNISKMFVTAPRAMTIPKIRGGFRVVHQLEPLEAVVYTAIAFLTAPSIEAARFPAKSQVACSYRFVIADGSFFASGTGWNDFAEKSDTLANEHSHVLLTDVTDFYNQIYLHRLNNAIEGADAKLKHLADDLEKFLGNLNGGPSKGLPVGPVASIVMAEAIMIDVDRFIANQGIRHTRYVDDIRLFGNSGTQLLQILEHLTLYLYNNHRLTVSSEKTELLDAQSFLKKHLHNQYLDEAAEVMEGLQEHNPYSAAFDFEEDYDESDDEEDQDELDEELTDAIEHVINSEHLDLGLARSVIRAARRASSAAIASHILGNFELFSPVINDVILYLKEITTPENVMEFVPSLEEIVASEGANSQLVRFWLENYLASHEEYMKSHPLNHFVFGGPNLENKALAAISMKNVAWVRQQKNSLQALGSWGRRAVLNASRILPSDEREHWLQLYANTPNLLDRWVASWVKAKP